MVARFQPAHFLRPVENLLPKLKASEEGIRTFYSRRSDGRWKTILTYDPRQAETTAYRKKLHEPVRRGEAEQGAGVCSALGVDIRVNFDLAAGAAGKDVEVRQTRMVAPVSFSRWLAPPGPGKRVCADWLWIS